MSFLNTFLRWFSFLYSINVKWISHESLRFISPCIIYPPFRTLAMYFGVISFCGRRCLIFWNSMERVSAEVPEHWVQLYCCLWCWKEILGEVWGMLQMERVRKSEWERERDWCGDWIVDIISWAQGLRGGNVMLFLPVSSLLPVWMSSPSLASSWAWTSFLGQCNQKRHGRERLRKICSKWERESKRGRDEIGEPERRQLGLLRCGD